MYLGSYRPRHIGEDAAIQHCLYHSIVHRYQKLQKLKGFEGINTFSCLKVAQNGFNHRERIKSRPDKRLTKTIVDALLENLNNKPV